MTNLEKIKAMNIEEMAHFLDARTNCFQCPMLERCKKLTHSNCEKSLKKWLESEADKASQPNTESPSAQEAGNAAIDDKYPF